jgi:hypothetical protein
MLTASYGQHSLQLSDLARFLIARTIPFEQKSARANGRSPKRLSIGEIGGEGSRSKLRLANHRNGYRARAAQETRSFTVGFTSA